MDSHSLYHGELTTGEYHPKVTDFYFRKWDGYRMLNLEFAFAAAEGNFPSIKDLAEANQTLSALLSMNHPYVVLKDPNEVCNILKR